jgi:acetyl-CoA decarbonylase/synthase complex subunit gamma
VSANYRLSFDHLRRELDGLAAWILVLDTKGVNVWCAAGKGTFGTGEMIERIEVTALAKVVTHRTLIAPQLGAPGVAAHEVKKRSGFRVVYGPVRAKDTRAFLEAGMQATPEMRRVRFDLGDRLVIIPLELIQTVEYTLFAVACLFIVSGLSGDGYDSARALAHGSRAALLLCLSVLGGCALTPMLLPWLPGRAFSSKGATIGILLACCVILLGWIPWDGPGDRLEMVAWCLMMPAVSAFLAMNFTGSSTYTSLSGVKREMRVAVPAQLMAAVTGLALWIAARFF